jgi:hypothetical protein
MPNLRCPWYLSARAVNEFVRILHLNPRRDADFNRAEDLLIEITRAAKFSCNQDNGLQLWLSIVPLSERAAAQERHGDRRQPDWRLQLLVSTKAQAEGSLPQLVRVLQRGTRQCFRTTRRN